MKSSTTRTQEPALVSGFKRRLRRLSNVQQGIPWVEPRRIIQREASWSRAFRSASCTGHRRMSYSLSQLRRIAAAQGTGYLG